MQVHIAVRQQLIHTLSVEIRERIVQSKWCLNMQKEKSKII